MQKFDRRKETVEKMIELRIVSGAEEVDAWRFLEKVLEYLGPEGMSSDETCDGVTERVFRVKVMEWHRPMDEYLKVIDDLRFQDDDLFNKQGSVPAKRLRDGTVKSARPPVQRLPHTLYNPTWIAKQPSSVVRTLSVSRDQFEWLRIIATTAQSM